MPRFHNINGESVQFTAEEEAARDAEEQAYADAAPARALAELRRKRDDLLKESDWNITSELEKGNAISLKPSRLITTSNFSPKKYR